MTKHILSLVVSLSILITTNLYATNGNMGGDTQNGSADYPYLIEDFNDFQVFTNDPNYWATDIHTKLTCNLDLDPNLPGREIYTIAVIAPITSPGSPTFAGSFDGNRHVIRNLTINGEYASGLFGYLTSNALIDNLGIEDALIIATENYIGLLAGFNHGSITRCYSTGSVTGNDYVGGLVGSSNGSSITNCYSIVLVNSSNYAGGLCGKNGGKLSNCYSNSMVSGGNNSEYLGGLCGENHGNIINCYAAGSVTGGNNSYNLGGLCGLNRYGAITNCYATSSVTSGDDPNNIGGLCGQNDKSTIINCFWDIETSGITNSDGGTGKTTAEMKTASTFTDADWDFIGESTNGTNETWQIPTGGDYPVLSIFNGYLPIALSGDGSQTNPYLISNVEELGAIYLYNTNAYYKLVADIDLTGTQWSTAIIPVFGGCFDGNDHTINNLTISAANSHLGLFGQINGSDAEVKNLALEKINIIGVNHSSGHGGLCGENRLGTIINCHSHAQINGMSSMGVLCGSNSGTISKCYAIGSVTGTGEDRSVYLGGLCGINSGTINKCYSNSMVISGDSSEGIGGLCGFNHGTIGNCYAVSSVTAGEFSEEIGGLCGYNQDGEISNCYSTGAVTAGADSQDIGGLCGENLRGSINNSLWDIETSGRTLGYNLNSHYPGTVTNVVGKTTAQMKTVSTFLDADWDLVAVWNIEQGQTYPLLRKYSAFDTNYDKKVNFIDFADFANHWLDDVE